MALYYAQEFPVYQRAMRNILTITNSDPMVITTTYNGLIAQDHNYLSGLIVRLYIPKGFGMEQAHQLQGIITVINATQFSLPVNSTTFDPFVVPPEQPGDFYTPAQVVPVGEIASQLDQATQNILPYP